MRFRTNGLMGMITGSGRVSLLSGRIWPYRVGLSLTGRIWLHYVVRACEPLGHSANRLGRAEDSAQKPNSNKKFFFFFKSVL
jgi:hypothetical protein